MLYFIPGPGASCFVITIISSPVVFSTYFLFSDCFTWPFGRILSLSKSRLLRKEEMYSNIYQHIWYQKALTGGSSFYVRWAFTLSKVGVHIRHIITKGVGGHAPLEKK